jgi:cell division protein FtsB
MPGTNFIVDLVLISTIGWIITSWIRARHGYPLTDDNGKTIEKDSGANRKIELLSSENERLKSQLDRLEERLSVLERIATDPAERTARQIEELRSAN